MAAEFGKLIKGYTISEWKSWIPTQILLYPKPVCLPSPTLRSPPSAACIFCLPPKGPVNTNVPSLPQTVSLVPTLLKLQQPAGHLESYLLAILLIHLFICSFNQQTVSGSSPGQRLPVSGVWLSYCNINGGLERRKKNRSLSQAWSGGLAVFF